MFLLLILILGLVFFIVLLRVILAIVGLFFGRVLYPGRPRLYRRELFFWRPWGFRRRYMGGFYGPRLHHHHHHHHHHRGW
ncbi:hypothetical protein [Ktedonobacter racemifer]|uniref:Uncharacterized protein n=1 Tax=Ktedonobacter racemifer DSM 44963 TaxID=485913 RepID=D6U0L7_KTERA|nr:hypothetical protein [Ktedonobacter racemifer]EFH82357.1 hypothetical protein Krac_3165 [Ktedonobacter racemifer DSM 44963]